MTALTAAISTLAHLFVVCLMVAAGIGFVVIVWMLLRSSER